MISNKHLYVSNFLITNLNVYLSDNAFSKYTFCNKFDNYYVYYKESKYSNYEFCLNEKCYCIININKPEYGFYAYINGNKFAYTNNFKILYELHKNDDNLKLTINYNSLKELILFNTPLFSKTIFNDVKFYQDKSQIIIEEQKISLKEAKISSEQHTSIIDFYDSTIKKTINDSIENSLKNCILLSGGYESRINAAAGSCFFDDFSTLTWNLPGADEDKLAKKVAEKIKSNHIVLDVDLNSFSYNEFLIKTAFSSSIQYAFRYSMIKQVYESVQPDNVLTGWGETNGFTPSNQQSEYYTLFLLKYFTELKPDPEYLKGWDSKFVLNYDFSWLYYYSKDKTINERIFYFKEEFLSKNIIGRVINSEQTITNIIAPWFDKEYYKLINEIESKKKYLIYSRKKRIKWKYNLYYNLIKKYNNQLNFIPVESGWVPFLFSNTQKNFGLPVAFMLKKIKNAKQKSRISMESKDFLISQLQNILDSNVAVFDKDYIKILINKKTEWSGKDYYDIHKFVHVKWILDKFE